MTYLAAILAAAACFLVGLALGVRRCPEDWMPEWEWVEPYEAEPDV